MAFDLTKKTFEEIITLTRSTNGSSIDANGNILLVGIDAPRFDYSDGTRHLLIEAASTNLLPYSAASVANWSNSSATLTDLTDNALGMFPGVRVASAGSDSQRINTGSLNLTTGVTYACQMWWKPGSSANARIAVRGQTSTNQGNIVFSVSGGVPTFVSDTPSGTVGAVVHVATTLRNGIYRTDYLFTPATTEAYALGVGPLSSTVGEYIDAYAAQVEVGTVPTSYIPTNGTAATRAADFYTVDVSNMGLQGGYTISVKLSGRGVPGVNSRLLTLDPGSGSDNNQRLAITSSGTLAGFDIYSGGIQQASGYVSYTQGADAAWAMRIGPDNFMQSFNGVLGPQDSSVSFVPPTILRFGHGVSGTSAPRMRVKSLLIYPALLSDAALTALGTV